LVETRLHGLARGNFAFGDFGGQFGNGELVEHPNFQPGQTNIEHPTFNIQRPMPGRERL
jgi:hypothetical protein